MSNGPVRFGPIQIHDLHCISGAEFCPSSTDMNPDESSGFLGACFSMEKDGFGATCGNNDIVI